MYAQKRVEFWGRDGWHSITEMQLTSDGRAELAGGAVCVSVCLSADAWSVASKSCVSAAASGLINTRLMAAAAARRHVLYDAW